MKQAVAHENAELIDTHVSEERELNFLKASQAALDLRGMTLPLLRRKLQLKKKTDTAQVKEHA
jgi:hypothetical protein